MISIIAAFVIGVLCGIGGLIGLLWIVAFRTKAYKC